MRIKKRIIFILSLGLCTALLFGCSNRQATIALQSDEQDVHVAEAKLAKSAESISDSLQELAAIERASHPARQMASPVDADMIGMAQLISVDWTGPIGAFVEKLAKTSNYRMRILGKSPAIPIIISITAHNTPLADVLRDANFQCGRRANVAIYAANKVIELRYAKN
ncbi:MAG: type IVB secretion system lipoprotein DotD [Gammaproteobacteria bacterium]